MIRSTFYAFETAKQALNVSQAGLDTVGHNISNANTAGYTRQRVDQVSISLNGMSSKYQAFGNQNTGMGASISGITQIRDPYLDNRYRAEATNNGELGVKYDGLTDINNIFDEITTIGLHAKFGDLINSLDIFAQQADSPELAGVLRNTAKELVSMLNKNARQLEEARAQQTADFKTTVQEDVNNILQQIADLNVKIKEDNFYGNPSNELNDTRNMLIDRLSEYVDIKVVKTPTKVSADLTVETLSIELRDSGEPPIMLVDGRHYNGFKVTEDPETGNVGVKVVDGLSGGDLPNGEVTSKLYKGALKGYIDVINGVGPNAKPGESTFKGIPYYQAALDEFAQKLAEVFNRINNITEQEAAESGDPPLLQSTNGYKNLFAPLTLDLGASKPSWIDTISAGTMQFSGSVYDMSFEYDSSSGKITATDKDGNKYYGTYEANGKIKFTDNDPDLVPGDPGYKDGGNIVFTIKTTGEAPDATSNVTIDARVSAKNISLTSSWLADPQYITTTKKNPVTEVKSELTLYGNSNPVWLRSVANGPETATDPTMRIYDGTYQFEFDDPANPTKVSVWINGLEYTGDYKKDSTIELKNATTGKVGLIIQTNSKAPGKTDLENTATIKNITGAAADNLNKLKVAIKDANNYLTTGSSGNFQEFLVDFQKDMSLDKSDTGSKLDASTTIISGYADRRDAVSAVSVDEEGINMMTYQNYYNAAARYMTALDEALDKIINGMGTVGR